MNPFLKYINGTLCLAGKPLHPVAARFGTPVYIYSKEVINEKLLELRENFPDGTIFHYAVKANTNPQILKFIRSKKIGADVVSLGELKRVLKCGFKPNSIVFSGVGKSEEEIRFAIKKNILLNIECLSEALRVQKLATSLKKAARVSLRINPDVDADTHPYITTGFRENKFGMAQEELIEVSQKLSQSSCVIVEGLSFHIGSQRLSDRPYVDAFSKLSEVVNALKASHTHFKHINMGGGFGIPYQMSEKPILLSEIARAAKEFTRKWGLELHCEPGRYLLAQSGVLVTLIEYIKKTQAKNFAIVNTGMHHLARPALYGAFHNILPLKQGRGSIIRYEIVGPICESADAIGKGRDLHELNEGEFLAVCDVGAYGFVMASNYNLQPLPKEILV
ncbi:MAG: diaminopimelate decarboxylase [Oligoflexia bacterium]|nr:diaminopimelate decarboxylase [Oligoflexia bacterium]